MQYYVHSAYKRLEELRFLADNGCSLIHGYKPMEAIEHTRILREVL